MLPSIIPPQSIDYIIIYLTSSPAPSFLLSSRSLIQPLSVHQFSLFTFSILTGCCSHPHSVPASSSQQGLPHLPSQVHHCVGKWSCPSGSTGILCFQSPYLLPTALWGDMDREQEMAGDREPLAGLEGVCLADLSSAHPAAEKSQ